MRAINILAFIEIIETLEIILTVRVVAEPLGHHLQFSSHTPVCSCLA
jgi:hypothetical protein